MKLIHGFSEGRTISESVPAVEVSNFTTFCGCCGSKYVIEEYLDYFKKYNFGVMLLVSEKPLEFTSDNQAIYEQLPIPDAYVYLKLRTDTKDE